ncbi:MarR family winged helix-turn-helix transcriptional regulator [Lacisediminihabitans sp. FW035]
MTDPPALSDDELSVWRSFYAMRRTLDGALDLQLQRDSKLSASEYEVLLAINVAPERRLRVKEIAATIGWEKSRVSHLVTRMEKRELVDRTRCASDARSTWIGLTPHGRRAVLGGLRGHSAAIRRYFLDALEGDEGERLSALSARVVAAIGCGADEDLAEAP